MPETPSHLIIYDRSNYDSLVCAAIQKFYISQSKPDDEIIALNWDEIPYTASTSVNTIKSQCSTISLCATIIDPNIIRIMYNAVFERFLSIQFSPLYKDMVASVNSNIMQLFNQRTHYSELAEYAILNVGQSATLTLYNYIYKNPTYIPLFYRYLDGFVTDSYYEYNLSRNAVVRFENGLTALYNNDFDKVYEFILENTPTGISEETTMDIEMSGEPVFDETYRHIIDHFKKYGGVTWDGDKKGGIIRRILPLFTSERLSTDILTDPLFEQKYDGIVTFNQLKNGYWEMCMYNIIHNIDVDDFDNLTIEQRRTIRLNTFSAGIYMKKMYNGFGNDIYGYALISNEMFRKIISLKEV